MAAGERVVIAAFMHRAQERGGVKTIKRLGDCAGANYGSHSFDTTKDIKNNIICDIFILLLQNF